jgi:hypothetical protein
MMNDREVRELVRIRHELRTLADRSDSGAALPLLEKMSRLAMRDAGLAPAVQGEMQRWRFRFRIDGT